MYPKWSSSSPPLKTCRDTECSSLFAPKIWTQQYCTKSCHERVVRVRMRAKRRADALKLKELKQKAKEYDSMAKQLERAEAKVVALQSQVRTSTLGRLELPHLVRAKVYTTHIPRCQDELKQRLFWCVMDPAKDAGGSYGQNFGRIATKVRTCRNFSLNTFIRWRRKKEIPTSKRS